MRYDLFSLEFKNKNKKFGSNNNNYQVTKLANKSYGVVGAQEKKPFIFFHFINIF